MSLDHKSATLFLERHVGGQWHTRTTESGVAFVCDPLPDKVAGQLSLKLCEYLSDAGPLFFDTLAPPGAITLFPAHCESLARNPQFIVDTVNSTAHGHLRLVGSGSTPLLTQIEQSLGLRGAVRG